jgi:glycerol-3-phosphate acyltransferase PlsY
MTRVLLAVISSYLLGSIPTAYIFGKRLKGIDIREHGSGNVGATNVFRVLGKGPGVCVLLLDIIKGFVPLVLLTNIFQINDVRVLLLLAVAAVCGHNWTVFLNFKGGKGIATSFGALIGLAVQVANFRPVLLGAVLVWGAVFGLTAIISVASIAAALALPVLMMLTGQPVELILLGAVFCLFVVVRHRPNIRRLLSGQEPKVPLPFHSPRSK